MVKNKQMHQAETHTQKNEIVITRISKGDDRFVQLAVKNFKGSSFFDVRVYSINGHGLEVPTIKGVTFSRKNVLRLRQACDDALRVIDGGDLI